LKSLTEFTSAKSPYPIQTSKNYIQEAEDPLYKASKNEFNSNPKENPLFNYIMDKCTQASTNYSSKLCYGDENNSKKTSDPTATLKKAQQT